MCFRLYIRLLRRVLEHQRRIERRNSQCGELQTDTYIDWSVRFRRDFTHIDGKIDGASSKFHQLCGCVVVCVKYLPCLEQWFRAIAASPGRPVVLYMPVVPLRRCDCDPCRYLPRMNISVAVLPFVALSSVPNLTMHCLTMHHSSSHSFWPVQSFWPSLEWLARM